MGNKTIRLFVSAFSTEQKAKGSDFILWDSPILSVTKGYEPIDVTAEELKDERGVQTGLGTFGDTYYLVKAGSPLHDRLTTRSDKECSL